jgi:aryl-alcohol dehydrogenase-like predicted oxidoreductase
MQTKQLGTSNLKLTRVGLGTWAIGGGDWQFGWGDQDEQEAVAAIIEAVDLGVNWIDTAAVYGGGRSEELVGEAIKQLGPDRQPIVATKCGRVMRAPDKIDKVLTRESVIAECEASLQRLGIDCIDLYQLHWPEPDEQIEEGWSTLVDLKKQGKVREIGVSNHNAAQLERLQAIHPVVSLQPPYNMLNRSIESKILPYCRDHQIGVIAYSPMAKGLLTGRFSSERASNLTSKDHRSRDANFQSPTIDVHLGLVECLKPIAEKHQRSLAELAIAWTLRTETVTAAIVGARRPDQIRSTAAAADWQLPQEDLDTIEQLLAGHQTTLRQAASMF